MNTENIMYALEIMGKGMLSIFVVILLLTFIVYFLGKLAGRQKNKGEAED
jgi:Na+-transporting methylmalonyl-CoA/oxaloacetate decarboxylase gamma subunit